MSFDQRMMAFAARFLSRRSFELIVAPAIADLQFEDSAGSIRRAGNRVAVLRAVAGGLGDDLARVSGGMLALTLIPACYYIFLLVICFDVYSLSISSDFAIVAALILVVSFCPVLVCFWPERPDARPTD